MLSSKPPFRGVYWTYFSPHEQQKFGGGGRRKKMKTKYRYGVSIAENSDVGIRLEIFTGEAWELAGNILIFAENLVPLLETISQATLQKAASSTAMH
jgi:hypothetical protein